MNKKYGTVEFTNYNRSGDIMAVDGFEHTQTGGGCTALYRKEGDLDFYITDNNVCHPASFPVILGVIRIFEEGEEPVDCVIAESQEDVDAFVKETLERHSIPSIMKSRGFTLEDNGGGCKAYYRTVGDYQIIITDTDSPDAPTHFPIDISAWNMADPSNAYSIDLADQDKASDIESLDNTLSCIFPVAVDEPITGDALIAMGYEALDVFGDIVYHKDIEAYGEPFSVEVHTGLKVFRVDGIINKEIENIDTLELWDDPESFSKLGHIVWAETKVNSGAYCKG